MDLIDIFKILRFKTLKLFCQGKFGRGFLFILLLDLSASIVIPIFLRQLNSDTKHLFECKEESGYILYSNKCDGNPHFISLFASIIYSLSIFLSLVFLSISVFITNIENDKIQITKLLDLDKIVMIFFIRNITMFNLMNFVSHRSDDGIVIYTVKSTSLQFYSIIVSSVVLSAFLTLTFPSELMLKIENHRFKVMLLIFMIWFCISSSILYYIGATNVLDRNVLTMYDLRGPELLILNYWNYGIVFIICCEFLLLMNFIFTIKNEDVRSRTYSVGLNDLLDESRIQESHSNKK
jgi:hypothetical protein